MFQLLEIFYVKQFYNYVHNLKNFKQDFVSCHRVSGVPPLLFRTTLLPSPPSCKQLQVKICLKQSDGKHWWPGRIIPQDQVDAGPHAPPMWQLALHLFIIIIIIKSSSSFIHQRLISAINNICRTFKFSCMIQPD